MIKETPHMEIPILLCIDINLTIERLKSALLIYITHVGFDFKYCIPQSVSKTYTPLQTSDQFNQR